MSTTFNARIEHVSHTTSRATVRSHTVLVDRPVAKGGRDLGPGGGEYLLVALGGCCTSHLLAASHARDAAISDVRGHVACQVVSTFRQVAPIAIAYEGSTIELGEPAAV
jgi:putative redox protein